MNQYLEKSDELGHSSIIEERIADAYDSYVEGVSRRIDFMSAQTLSGSVYAQVMDEIDSAIDYADTLSEAGYTVDREEITRLRSSFDADYRQRVIDTFNEITTRDTWSRTEAWNLMQDTDNMYDSSDLEDPIRLRYCFALAYFIQKEAETQVAEGTITAKGAAQKIAGVISDTDYNLMLIYEYIQYMYAAGEDCSDVENAYYTVIQYINNTQGIQIGSDIDVYKFWSFNDFGEYSYGVEDGDVNGLTTQNRQWIRDYLGTISFTD